ncbi:hypothetical protein [Burkholderia phage vB_BpP_HN03]|uniref:Uncharacterized protein n=1 Tax=Burkholderia phage vB_BpP_HN02 TaxID=3116925 RepID=A0AAX4JH18_9CAUD
MLTKELVAKALPTGLRNVDTQAIADDINNAVSDPVLAQQIADNFVSYSSVMAEGKYKTEDYVSAVKYVSFKLMGDTNQDAYFKTFPQRYAALLARGATSKDISAYVSAYAKGKLVNSIIEKSLVPSWVLNQHLHQEAINVQAQLMRSAQSEKVRMEAANSLLSHLAKPKEAGPLVNIDMRESSGLADLKATLGSLAQQQRDLIAAGVTAKALAAQKIVDAEDV